MNSSHSSDQRERNTLPINGQDSPPTTDVAKDQTAKTADKAGAAAQQVAGAAKEQASQVAGEVGDQLKSLLSQSKSEFADQAQTQQQRAANGLHSLADQLGTMADGAKDQGVVTDVAQQAAQKAHQMASWLDDREPGAVLSEVRNYARRRPGMFLLAALGAGVVVGRFARGLAADPNAEQAQSTTTPGSPAHPVPAVSAPPLAATAELTATGEPWPAASQTGQYR